MGQGIHLCQQKSKFHLRPLGKSTKIGIAWCLLVQEKKCELKTPTILGQGIHLCRRKSKFHLRPLRKSTKMGLAWCLLVLEKKCKLKTPHNFGSRNPSVLTEIKISPSAIKKKHQNGSSLVSVGPREKVRNNYPPTILGQGIHLCWWKSKFHLRQLGKSTKMGLAWCPLVLEKKCKLTTPPQFWVKESICVDGNQNFTYGH